MKKPVRKIRKLVFLFCASIVFFFTELGVFHVFGHWFKPNLLVILLVFSALKWGVRYSIFVALCAGFFKDSFSYSPFGIYCLSFIVCAYTIAAIMKYFYKPTSIPSKVFLTTMIVFLNLIVSYCLSVMFKAMNFSQAFRLAMLPEIMATVLITVFVFKGLQQCASKLSV